MSTLRKREKIASFLYIEHVYVKEAWKIGLVPSHRACLR